MSNTLCFDFGNTRLKAAFFEGDRLKETFILENGDVVSVEKLVQLYKPEKTVLASVIDHSKEVEDYLRAHSKLILIDHHTQYPVTTPVGKPETIGADRWALVVAANEMFPKKNNLVIALGTCITYNFVNQYAEFLGGSISPGLQMRFNAMNHYTAKLPLVSFDEKEVFPLVAYDTRTNLLSGVIWGMAKEIDGVIEADQGLYGNFNAVLTGGNSGYFARHLKNKIFADPDLIFKGLNVIGRYN